jgi:hypothetical protein
LRQVCSFLRVLPVSPTNKTDRHDITEILLKVVLNTLTLIISDNLKSNLQLVEGSKYLVEAEEVGLSLWGFYHGGQFY